MTSKKLNNFSQCAKNMNERDKTTNSFSPAEKDEQSANSSKIVAAGESNSSVKEVISGFDADWNDLDQSSSRLLADYGEIKIQRMRETFETARRCSSYGTEQAGETETGQSDRLLDAVNIATLPFHHLTSLKHLATAFDVIPVEAAAYEAMGFLKRRQSFWQALAARGVPAKEAALLDGFVECRFTGNLDGSPVEVNWEILYFDDLQGCGELYLAEMFLVKQHIYRMGDNLRAGIEFTGDDLERYLPPEDFAPLPAGKAEELFFDTLSASYNLTVSSQRDAENRAPGNQDNSSRAAADETTPGKNIFKKVKKMSAAPGNLPGKIDRFETQSASRINGFMERSLLAAGTGKSDRSRKFDEDGGNGESGKSGDVVYRLRLSDYWLAWQKAARVAKFDFDYLQTLNSARAARFYELTKLWRAFSKGGTAAAAAAAALPPDKLEIGYEKFAALVPLPLLHSEWEIKRQITDLIEPLKKNGYVKSFTFKADWRGRGNHGAVLRFRFND